MEKKLKEENKRLKERGISKHKKNVIYWKNIPLQSVYSLEYIALYCIFLQGGKTTERGARAIVSNEIREVK